MQVPKQFLFPSTDNAARLLELWAASEGAPRMPLKLGKMVSGILEIIRPLVGEKDLDEDRWTTAIKDAAHRLKDGDGCLSYTPPLARGGHGQYELRRTESTTREPSSAEAERKGYEAPAYVYAWCLPFYQNSDPYPVKVGWTEREPEKRIRDNLTDLPETPRLIMSIACSRVSEAQKTEQLFHHVLRVRGRAIEGAGSEWYRTTLQELLEIKRFIYGNDED